MLPQAIFFDLDGTLHDRNATIRLWLKRHVRQFQLPAGYTQRFIALDDYGYRSKKEVFPQLVAEFGLKHDPQDLLDDYSSALQLAQPMPYAQAVLKKLRAHGVKISVVTNGWFEAQTQCMQVCGLSDLVDDLVMSKVVGFSKPDKEIYALALERLGVSARHCWFVGDSPKNDIWGPQQVGLRAAYLPTQHALNNEKPDAVLSDLRDVLNLPDEAGVPRLYLKDPFGNRLEVVEGEHQSISK